MVVVGLGVGGEEVAERLAEAGLSVVGIERDLVGGECPYWGCIPSKMMIRAANALAEARRVDGLAGTAQVQPDWAPVAQADPRGGHRHLGRHGCGRAVHGHGRPARPGQRPPRRPWPGPRRRPGVRGSARGRAGHRDPSVGATDRRPGRHAVLDQPPGDRGRGAAGVAAGARRRRDRPGAGTGLRPLRGPGHGGGGARPGAGRRGTGGVRGRRRGAARRRRGDPHRGTRRAGRARRRPGSHCAVAAVRRSPPTVCWW